MIISIFFFLTDCPRFTVMRFVDGVFILPSLISVAVLPLPCTRWSRRWMSRGWWWQRRRLSVNMRNWTARRVGNSYGRSAGRARLRVQWWWDGVARGWRRRRWSGRPRDVVVVVVAAAVDAHKILCAAVPRETAMMITAIWYGCHDDDATRGGVPYIIIRV